MKTPTARHYNSDRGTSTLYWGREDQGEYYVRGGVCWPITVETARGSDVQGYAVLVGQDVKTKICHVFKQCEFVTVDHIIVDVKIKYPGVATWFNDSWSQYFGRKFYWKQDEELTRSYRTDVFRSEMISPKPQIIEIDWSDDQAALHLIWRFVKTGKLKFGKDSILHKQLGDVKKGDKDLMPAVHALSCAIAGIGRYPFREPE